MGCFYLLYLDLSLFGEGGGQASLECHGKEGNPHPWYIDH